MKVYRVVWDGTGVKTGEKVVSIVGYDKPSAERRAALLIAAKKTGVEIIECKPGEYDRI